MKAKLIDIASVIFEVPATDITLGSTTNNIESWDSMNHMNFILAIEEEFGRKIPDDVAVELLSIQDILNYLETP